MPATTSIIRRLENIQFQISKVSQQKVTGKYTRDEQAEFVSRLRSIADNIDSDIESIISNFKSNQ
jgi:hypothetical protein